MVEEIGIAIDWNFKIVSILFPCIEWIKFLCYELRLLWAMTIHWTVIIIFVKTVSQVLNIITKILFILTLNSCDIYFVSNEHEKRRDMETKANSRHESVNFIRFANNVWKPPTKAAPNILYLITFETHMVELSWFRRNSFHVALSISVSSSFSPHLRHFCFACAVFLTISLHRSH